MQNWKPHCVGSQGLPQSRSTTRTEVCHSHNVYMCRGVVWMQEVESSLTLLPFTLFSETG